MNRTTARILPGVASATALIALLSACSQPASYASVDLSGSYPQSAGEYAQSTQQSAPVYQSTQAYTYAVPAQPNYAAPYAPAYQTAQLPQVASIDPTLGYESIGSLPGYQPFAAPALVDEPGLLRADTVLDPNAYIDIGQSIDVTPPAVPEYQTSYLSPGAGTIDIDALPPPAVKAAPPVYEMVSPQYQPFQPQLESAPLAAPSAPLPEVSSDYTYLPEDPQPEPLTDPNYTDAGDYINYRSAQDPQPIQTRFPSPIAPVIAPPAQSYEPPATIPRPINAYPRPYEGLRPGVFPPAPDSGTAALTEVKQEIWTELAAAESIEDAPVAAQSVVYLPTQSAPIADNAMVYEPIEIAEAAPMAQSAVVLGAESHLIQEGETLYRIAQNYRTTPEILAATNGMTVQTTIFPGQQLLVPVSVAGGEDALSDAPVVVLDQDQPIQHHPVDSLVIQPEIGGPGAELPVISPELGRELLASQTVHQQSAPRNVEPNFGWPVHGQVYRLKGGQIEIATPAGQMVRAAAAGRVIGVEHGTLGTLIMIEHEDGWRSHTFGLAHAKVVVGQPVYKGTQLGPVDSPGRIRLELRDGSSRIAEVLGLLRKG